MQLSYNNVESFINAIFSQLGFHQLGNLILVVYGIIHCRSLECAQIARYVPTQTSHHHTKKRVYEFLNNDRVDWEQMMSIWCRFVVAILLYNIRMYLPVIVDITWVNGEKYLVAAIPFLCRSIPIAFRRFTDEEIRKGTSQNLIENAFFTWLSKALSGYRVVIIADRGFRRASLLIHLKGLGLDYVIRVCGNVRVKAGTRRYFRNAIYHKTEQITTHLVIGKLKAEKGKKLEPWYIATSLNDLDKAYELYRQRFWIEEMFRDLKSRFHWCRYKVETPERREHLTFCLMVSYTMVALLGYQVQKTGRAPMVSSYGKSSITWLGIAALNHKKLSASELFRQIRRRFDRITLNLVA